MSSNIIIKSSTKPSAIQYSGVQLGNIFTQSGISTADIILGGFEDCFRQVMAPDGKTVWSVSLDGKSVIKRNDATYPVLVRDIKYKYEKSSGSSRLKGVSTGCVFAFDKEAKKLDETGELKGKSMVIDNPKKDTNVVLVLSFKTNKTIELASDYKIHVYSIKERAIND